MNLESASSKHHHMRFLIKFAPQKTDRGGHVCGGRQEEEQEEELYPSATQPQTFAGAGSSTLPISPPAMH